MSSTDAEPAAVAVTPTKTADSAPSTPSKEVDEALTQLVQGRRHLLVRDYSSAVAALAKGCELLAVKYGDTAPECGDAYLTYGRALLELARSESGVLAVNEADKSDEEADDEDAEEEDEDAEDQEAEEGAEAKEVEEDDDAEAKEVEKGGAEAKEVEEGGAEAKKEAHEEEACVEEKNKNGVKENGVKENGVKENVAVSENGKDSEEAKEGEVEEEEEDVNNLQLAWEMLELAKVIFQKQLETADDKVTALKLAEVNLKLGEVGVESENYSTAIEDIKSCLEIQKQHLEEDDRRIAETLYNLGVAYSLCNEFDDAIEHFKSASNQIEKRIANLERKKEEPARDNKISSEDPFYTIESEIEELKALLPEMKEKVTDMHDFKKETMRRMMDGLAEVSAKKSSTADGAGPSSASDKPVSSVAHLVKRKPKDESKDDTQGGGKLDEADPNPDETSLEKKRKQDDITESDCASKKLKAADSP